MAPFPEMDRQHVSRVQQPSLARWASNFHMTDVWRHFHPSDREYTCLSTTHRTLSRIDLVFASPALLRRVVSAEILSRGISDHAPVSVTVRISDMEGVRVWRLSKYWIADPDIQEEMQEALCAFWITNIDSAGPLVLWDTLKSWLRGEYMSRIAKKKGSLCSP